MKCLPAILTAWLLAGTLWAIDVPDISNYRVILDKAPFGAVDPKGAPVLQPAYSEHLQLVAIVISNAGAGPVQAVIYDKDANRSYFKTDGEMIDAEIKVVHVEETPAKVVLQKGLESATLTFQDRPNTAVSASPTPNFHQPPGMPVPNAPPSGPRRIPFRPHNP